VPKKTHPLIAQIKDAKEKKTSLSDKIRLRLKEQRLQRAAIDRAATALDAQEN
jgi:hypothetical protein